MKRRLSCIGVLLALCVSLFAETVVVLDFDTEILDYENNAVIMSDMLRAELVKTKKLEVIDRKSMNAAIHEIQSSMSDYMSDTNVKQLGRMLNADYLVIGHVLALSNTSASSPRQNIFLNTAEKILLGNDKVEVIAQMVDVETLRVLSSASIELKKWTEFSKYTKKMAYDLVASAMSSADKLSSQVLTNIKKANEDMLGGIWTAEMAHDGILDNYTVEFEENHRISVKVVSTSKKGKQTEAEGNGRYTFNDNDKILSVTVNTLRGDVKHLKSINW